jgi:hypothetical protein
VERPHRPARPRQVILLRRAAVGGNQRSCRLLGGKPA